MTSSRKGRRRRRGTIYLAVLGTTMMVALFAISALSIQRIQRRLHVQQDDVLQARLNAKTGIRMGMRYIENEPDWRFRVKDGKLQSHMQTGRGSYSLFGHDPTDGDVTDSSTDPFILTAAGKFRNATQNVSVTLLPSSRAYNCLEVGVCAEIGIGITDGTINFFGTIASNADIYTAGSSTVFAVAEAAGTVYGTGYQRANSNGTKPRELPDPVEVFSYYLQHGTSIDISSLPTITPNLLRNHDMEGTAEGWDHSWEDGTECQLTLTNLTAEEGNQSLHVSNRTDEKDGPCYYLTHAIKSGQTYKIRFGVRTVSDSDDFRILLNTKTFEATDQWVHGDWVEVEDSWSEVAATITVPSWTGDLERAMLKLESRDSRLEFYIDNVSLIETGTAHRISRQLLSDNENPFGPVNSEGIYLLDCQNRELLIEHSRIVGTLVLSNLGPNSRIAGPISWKPAIAGYPALMVNDDFHIFQSGEGLSETHEIVNFNPPSTPDDHLGANSDQTDIYPSAIHGVVYANGNLFIADGATFSDSAIIAEQSVYFSGTVRLTHTGAIQRSPPPGFATPEEIRVLLNSYQKRLNGEF